MRIIAGRWRGRRLKTPKDDRVRPTGDRVREAWMSIVAADLPHARVLDLCAGTGALGLEALSRGAASVDLVDTAPPSVSLLRENVALLDAGDVARVVRDDAVRFVAGLPAEAYDVAFADPPYDSDVARRLVESWLRTPWARLLCVEHRSRDVLPGDGETRTWGTASVTFLRYIPATPTPSA